MFPCPNQLHYNEDLPTFLLSFADDTRLGYRIESEDKALTLQESLETLYAANRIKAYDTRFNRES